MTKKRLKEIHDSIEFQMQLQQAVGYKNRYDDLLVEYIGVKGFIKLGNIYELVEEKIREEYEVEE